jgi:hypothetical protein
MALTTLPCATALACDSEHIKYELTGFPNAALLSATAETQVVFMGREVNHCSCRDPVNPMTKTTPRGTPKKLRTKFHFSGIFSNFVTVQDALKLSGLSGQVTTLKLHHICLEMNCLLLENRELDMFIYWQPLSLVAKTKF